MFLKFSERPANTRMAMHIMLAHVMQQSLRQKYLNVSVPKSSSDHRDETFGICNKLTNIIAGASVCEQATRSAEKPGSPSFGWCPHNMSGYWVCCRIPSYAWSQVHPVRLSCSFHYVGYVIFTVIFTVNCNKIYCFMKQAVSRLLSFG